MNLNATMLGQMLTFGIFVWFTMKFVWPVLDKILEERKAKIADGISAAEKGHRILEKAELDVKAKIAEAKKEGERFTLQARKQAEHILEEARNQAHKEKADIIASGRAQVDQALNAAKHEMQSKIAHLVVSGAEKIIAKDIKPSDHELILANVSKEMVG